MKSAFNFEKGERERYEDYHGSVDGRLFIVADGLGGRPYGEVASKLAVKTAEREYGKLKEKKPREILEHIFEKANEAVLQKAEEGTEYEGMGTTLVAVLIEGDKLWVSNVGDSRAYVLREGKLHFVSKDDRSMFGTLTKAVGVKEDINPHIFDYELREDELVLMSSDGLTDFVRDSEIKEVLEKDTSLKEKAEELVDLSLKNESTDNVTVGLIKKESEHNS